MAQLRQLAEHFPDELVVIGIHSAKFPSEKLTANLRQALMRHGVDHPVVNDAAFNIWQNFAVKAWPTVVLIDPQGKIVDTQSGEIMAEDYIANIEALIRESEMNEILDREPLAPQPERNAEPQRHLNYPAKLLLGPNQTLYIADAGHHRILEVQLAENGLHGQLLRVFGSGQAGLEDGSASEAQFHSPHGMALSGHQLYVADTENHAIRLIDLNSETVRTVAGTGEKAHGQFMLGQPTDVPLRSPWALVVEDSVLLIAMAGSHQIWVYKPDEGPESQAILGPFAGNGREALIDGPLAEASFNQPSDLALGMRHLFVADSEASAIRAISLSQESTVITLIGLGLFEYGDIDGTGSDVRLQHPVGLTYHQEMVYIADSYNHKIKSLDPTTGGVITLIGTGQPGYLDGSFDQAALFEPEGVVANGNHLYIADTNNHQIRVANLDEQTVHTLQIVTL